MVENATRTSRKYSRYLGFKKIMRWLRKNKNKIHTATPLLSILKNWHLKDEIISHGNFQLYAFLLY